jgi:hypothetical protein
MRARLHIANNFATELNAFPEKTGRRFLVTHGHSKTVKYVILKTVEALKKSHSNSIFDQVVLVMTGEGDSLETRLMGYDLKRRRPNYGWR